MKPKQVVNYFGSLTKAAAAIGVTEPTIRRWVTVGSIPLNAQKAISYDTNGALKPEVQK